MYHSVCDEIEDPWIQIRPASLAAQLDAVDDLGYTWVPLEEALRRPRDRVATLTFDDGLADFLAAAGILHSRGIPAALFVCPGLVGTTSAWTSSPSLRSRPLLRLDEIRDLARRGVTIGCHGWTHRCFLDLSPHRLEDDLGRCAAWLLDELGLDDPFLAYPYGRCDAERAAVVRRHHSVALAVDPLDGVPDRLAVPRWCGVEGADRERLGEGLAALDLGRRRRA